MHEGLLLLLISVLRCADGSFLRPKQATNQTSTSLSVHLQVVIPVQGVSLIPEPKPPVIYDGAGFNLSCKARKGTHLTYLWFQNKQELNSLSPLHRFVGNMLTVDRADERHAGSYLCMAKNMLRNTTRVSNSKMVTVVVKKYLSAPRLAFTLFHNGSGYYANISCRLNYGSPPVTFQLLLNGKHVDVQHLDLLEAWFYQPVTVGLDMGTVWCIAENDIQQLLSNSINLEVAPVTGHARVQVEYLHRAGSVTAAALLQCELTTGTFPVFQWSFNGSTIPLGANSPTFIQHDKVLVLTHISPRNLGYYSCRARDSFDSSSSWVESEEVLVKVTDLALTESTDTDFEATPIEVIAVVFCCFLFVMIIGGACCVLWNINSEHVPTYNHRTSQTDPLHHHGHINTDNRHAMSETQIEPRVEEMETVFMEVEV